jgi:hypothetical protein
VAWGIRCSFHSHIAQRASLAMFVFTHRARGIKTCTEASPIRAVEEVGGIGGDEAAGLATPVPFSSQVPTELRPRSHPSASGFAPAWKSWAGRRYTSKSRCRPSLSLATIHHPNGQGSPPGRAGGAFCASRVGEQLLIQRMHATECPQRTASNKPH